MLSISLLTGDITNHGKTEAKTVLILDADGPVAYRIMSSTSKAAEEIEEHKIGKS